MIIILVVASAYYFINRKKSNYIGLGVVTVNFNNSGKKVQLEDYTFGINSKCKILTSRDVEVKYESYGRYDEYESITEHEVTYPIFDKKVNHRLCLKKADLWSILYKYKNFCAGNSDLLFSDKIHFSYIDSKNKKFKNFFFKINYKNCSLDKLPTHPNSYSFEDSEIENLHCMSLNDAAKYFNLYSNLCKKHYLNKITNNTEKIPFPIDENAYVGYLWLMYKNDGINALISASQTTCKKLFVNSINEEKKWELFQRCFYINSFGFLISKHYSKGDLNVENYFDPNMAQKRIGPFLKFQMKYDMEKSNDVISMFEKRIDAAINFNKLSPFPDEELPRKGLYFKSFK